MCDTKKIRSVKQQKASGLLSSLAIRIKVNKFLLVGDKFMSEIHLLTMLVDHLLKPKKEYKNLKKQ